MSNNKLVFNPDTGQTLKYKQAVKKAAEGLIVLSEDGKTFRRATREDLPEILARRAESVRVNGPLAFAELPGIIVRDIKTDRELLSRAYVYAYTADADPR